MSLGNEIVSALRRKESYLCEEHNLCEEDPFE